MTNILLAHGSSDSRHAEGAQRLAEMASLQLGDAIELRYLSSEKMSGGATVLPLLLGEGWHARNDIIRLKKASSCRMLPTLAHHADAMAGMAADLADSAVGGKASAVFGVYHFTGFEGLTAALYMHKKHFPRMAIATMHSSPNLHQVMRLWQHEAVKNTVIQPLALFAGRTVEYVHGMAGMYDAVAGHEISMHPDFPAFIADCFRSAA